MEVRMKAIAIAFGLQFAAGLASAAGWQLAMGPNPGGKLGEDMPFQGDDVVRRAPAASAERERPSPAVPCPAASGASAPADHPESKDCTPAPAGTASKTPPAPSK
jgi:hypothetical protein